MRQSLYLNSPNRPRSSIPKSLASAPRAPQAFDLGNRSSETPFLARPRGVSGNRYATLAPDFLKFLDVTNLGP